MTKERLKFALALITVLILPGCTESQESESLKFGTRLESFLSSASPERQAQYQLSDREQMQLFAGIQVLPQSGSFSASELRAVYNYATTCLNPPSLEVDKDLKKTLAWHQSLCGQTELPGTFFQQGPFLHPAGYSFSFAEFQSGNKKRPRLETQIETLHLAEIESNAELLSYATPRQSLLLQLNADQRQILLGGQTALLTAKFFAVSEVKSSRFGEILSIKLYNRKLFNQITGAQFYPDPTIALSNCIYSWRGVCWSPSPDTWQNKVARSAPIVATGAALLILALSLISFAYSTVKRHQDRELIMRTMTHELRTPLTSLRLQLETLKLQTNSERRVTNMEMLQKSYQRLLHVVNMSADYLRMDADHDFPNNIDSLRNLFEGLLEDWREKLIHITVKGQDRPAKLPEFWLKVALDNLISNGIHHGQGQVSISLEIFPKSFKITVQDEGRMNDFNLKHFAKPFVRQDKSKGLGLGLSLVDKALGKLGTKLRCSLQPSTQFWFEVRG